MVLKLYGHIRSPCVRAVLLIAKMLRIELDFITLDISNKEHLKPQFLKKNPQHTLPTLDDNGTVLWDSHVIMMYLVEKYRNNNPLYPNDLQKRVVINRLLFFDAGNVFSPHLQICSSVLAGIKDIPKEPLDDLKKAIGFLELFLQKSKYVAGNEMTIADISLWTTLSNAQNFVPIDKNEYPKIYAWMKLMDTLPDANINTEGANLFKDTVKNILSN